MLGSVLYESADVQLGKTIRRRRIALGLSIESLAEICGLTPNYLGSVELGKRDPSLSTVLAIAKGLRVAPGELLGSVENLGPAGLEAGKLFEHIVPDDQVALLRLMRSLARRKR